MATYDSLTAEQKSIYEAWDRDHRAMQRTLESALMQCVQVDTMYTAQISPMSIDAGETPPVTGGLSGAQSLLYSEVTSLVAHIQGMLTNYNTSAHKELRNKAGGLVV